MKIEVEIPDNIASQSFQKIGILKNKPPETTHEAFTIELLEQHLRDLIKAYDVKFGLPSEKDRIIANSEERTKNITAKKIVEVEI
jgi:hypothetical protein